MRKFLRLLDVRWISIEYPGFTVSIWVAVMIAFAYPNIWKLGNLRGGPIDDALYPGDPYREQHERVISQSDFNAKELFPIIKFLDNGITAKALQEVLDLTRKLEDIPGFTVISPATLLEYKDDGEEIAGIPYITEEELKTFDGELWKKRVRKDGSVWGLFVGKNYDWISIAVIPATNNDNATFWQIASVLEQRHISAHEKLFLRDIYPIDPSLGGIGLGFARATIDQALTFDLVTLLVGGMCVSFLVLWWYLGSWMQAGLITVVSIVSGVWLTRGSIWFVHGIWPETHERVYELLAYANCIVQGGSLALHKIVAFREGNGISSKEKFICSAGIIDTVIFAIAILAIGPFLLSIRTLGVWQMVELGIIASIGVGIIALFLVILVLPAAYLVAERMRFCITGTREPLQTRRWKKQYHIPYLAKFQLNPAISIAIVTILFLHVSYLYVTGGIVSKTRPLDYITGTWTERSVIELEKRGAGNDTFSLFVWPRNSKTGKLIPVINNNFPAIFAEGVWRFQQALRPNGEFEIWQQNRYGSMRKIVWTGSIFDSVAMISRTSFTDENGNSKPFPTNDIEVSDALLITGDLSDGIERWVRNTQGIRISVFARIKDSVEFRELLEHIDAYAKEKFPMLEVAYFGKIIYFPRADQLIMEGMGWNVLSSVGMLVPFYALLIWWLHRGNSRYVLSPVPCGFILVVPFLFSIGLNGERMWLLGIPLSMSSAPISELTINAATDLGMILAAAYARTLKKGIDPQRAMHHALAVFGAVILMDCLLNCVAFSPLWISRFMPVHEVAGTMQLMLVACAAGVIVLMPRLLILATKERRDTIYDTSQNQNDSIGNGNGIQLTVVGY